MAFKVHEVKKYSYSFDARLGAIGGLQLWGDTARILTITFVDDGAQVPPPALSADLNSANAVFKRGALSGLVDMLRHEGPVSVTLNNQAPGFVFVHTGFEPVGEGEAV